MEKEFMFCFELEQTGDKLADGEEIYFWATSLNNLPIIGDDVDFLNTTDSPAGTYRVVGRLIEKSNLRDERPKRVTIYVEKIAE